MAREAEMVEGTWYTYFNKICDPVYTDKTLAEAEELLNIYGDFFERNLSKEAGPLLSLGAGFGQTEIPLARKGYKIIGIDNDRKVLKLLRKNAEKYGLRNVGIEYGDLYGDFHLEYLNRGIQACVSFGTLEHFTKEDLEVLIKKQFEISSLIICMMPIDTPETLKTYGAEGHPEAHIDENGIYRNFWKPEVWKNEIFKRHKIIDECYPINYSELGQNNMITLAVKKS